MNRFRADNTDGYDAGELGLLNAAWQSLPLPVEDDDDDATRSMLDHCAEQLLAAFDRGYRGDALIAWYYAP